MLTNTQARVLVAVHDYLKTEDRLYLGESDPLPPTLASLGLPPADVYEGVADLHNLGLIAGVMTGQADHPVLVHEVTALGRQQLR